MRDQQEAINVNETNTVDLLLIYPGERMAKPRLPMAVLTLATYCIENGISTRIIDERVDLLTREDIFSADYIGISTMSGAQLTRAISTAKRIKGIRPEVPLIWGGPHPSAYPVQTAKSELADYVIEAEGEVPLVELIKALKRDEGVDHIPSLNYFRKDGPQASNPLPESWLDIKDLPFPAYDTLDITKYADDKEGLSYETSRGCPFRCTFCYVEKFHKRKWRGKSVEKIISELRRIDTEIGVKKLYFIDDNFFGNPKRSLEICSRMIEEGFSFTWQATIRADILSKFTDDEVGLIRKSGCEIFAIGAESGSERILKKIKKGITPEQIKDAVAKCVKHGIMPQVSFVIGLPFEEDEDLEKTVNLYNDLMKCGKNIEINGLFIYMPYLGTPIFDIAVEYGYKPSDSLEEWGYWDLGKSDQNPWISPERRKRLETMSSIARFKYMRHRFEYYSDEYRRQKLGPPLVKLGYFLFVNLFSKMADLRWRHKYFKFGYEWRLWRFLTLKIFKIS